MLRLFDDLTRRETPRLNSLRARSDKVEPILRSCPRKRASRSRHDARESGSPPSRGRAETDSISSEFALMFVLPHFLVPGKSLGASGLDPPTNSNRPSGNVISRPFARKAPSFAR